MHSFKSRWAASQAAAAYIAGELRTRLNAADHASLIVSGGSSPSLCFQALSQIPLDWKNVVVIPSDERWVDAEHEDSNERMIRRTLLRHHAANATLIPMFRTQTDIASACRAVENDLNAHSTDFTCALLGMGEDGHFASLFPDAEQLQQGLNLSNTAMCLPVNTPSSPHPRMSLTLSALVSSQRILLLGFGDKKRAVLEAVKKAPSNYPIAALLHATSSPVDVFWAP